MACSVKYDNNKIITVFNQDGVESKLYKEIARNPHIESMEEALESYKNIYSDKLNLQGEEPSLSYKSDKGNYFNSFKDALNDSGAGDIEIIIPADGKDFVIKTVSATTNPNNFTGLVNSLIKDDILSDEKILDQGVSYFKAEGYDQPLQIVNERIVKDEVKIRGQFKGFKIHPDGRIEMSDSKDKVTIGGKQYSKSELNTEKLSNLENKLGKDEALNFVINKALREVLPSGLSGEKIDINEEALALHLLDLLNSLGVKVMSIESYIKNYKIRNGVDPSAEALADIANQVVAFKEGIITLESLTEEAAHFIVEAWEQSEIENLLRNVHKTDTYVEFSEFYREIYAREYPKATEEEIENLVRREVLGKELAKAIRNNFDAAGKTETQTNIWRRMYDLLMNFFNKLTVTDEFKRDLDTLSNKVNDVLLSKDISRYMNAEQFKNKKFRLYQAQPSGNINIDAKNAVNKQLIRSLLEQEKNLRRVGRGSSANIEKLTNALDKSMSLSSILDLVSLAKSQARYVSNAIDEASRKGKTLSNEEGIVLYTLKEEIQPMLSRLNELIKGDAELGSVQGDIESALIDISSAMGKVDNQENQIVDNIIDRLIVRHNLDETHREELKKAVDSAMRDTQMLYAMFGQITHANDPLLNMLGSVIADMTLDAEQSYISRAKSFQKKIREHGFFEDDLKKFMGEDGYVLSAYDWGKFESDIEDIKVEAYKKYGETTMTDEELKKAVQENNLPKIKDADNEAAFRKEVSDKINENIERTFTDEYYTKREELYNQAGLSDVTKRELRMLSTDFGMLRARVKTEKGLPRYTNQDKHDLDALNLKRKDLKSLFDKTGNLKSGIREVGFPTATSITVNDVHYELDDSASEDARVAFEMTKLDQLVLDNKKKEGKDINIEELAPKFLEELERIEREEGREAAVIFFNLNSTIGFSNDFWENADTNRTFMDVINDYETNSDADEDVLEDIDTYKKLLAKRKGIIKQYQDSRNYTNIMAEEIPQQVRETILALSEEIDGIYDKLYSEFKDELPEREEGKVEFTTNQSYKNAIKDSRLKTNFDKISFCLKNMTLNNNRKVRGLQDLLNDYLKGVHLSERSLKKIQGMTGIEDLETITKDNAEEIVLKYAESKLAPYYRAFSPLGLESFYEQLENGTESVTSLVKDLNERPDIKMANNFSYYEMQDMADKNPRYKEDFEGGTRQPKLSKYKNQKFIDMFNPKTDSKGEFVLDAEGNMIAQKNQKLFDLYKDYIDFQKETLKSYGETGTHNIYIAPQVSKTTFDKRMSLLKGKKSSIKDIIQDVTRFRVDESVLGEEQDGQSLIKESGFRVIPKYFLKKLPDANFVTQDLFFSSMVMAQQAELYKSKRERYSEFSALHDRVLNRAYPEGKAAQSTRTYQMFKSYMDYNLYGVKEARTWRVNLPFLGQVDVTKVIDFFHNWLRNNSLALNFVVPVTSWLTAEASLIMEKYIGQYVDKGSFKLATNEFKKIATEAATEGLNINSKARLSILGEHFRIFDITNRFENAQYDKYSRLLSKSYYGLHQMMNFTPLSRAMLAVLYGHRIYEGKLVDFNQFKKLYQQVNTDASDSDVTAKWATIEDKAFYNYIMTNDKNGNPLSEVTYDYEALAKDMNETNNEEFQAKMKNIQLGISGKLKKIVERIDGQISSEERTALQRDVLGRFTMTHKGWLSIAASNRFKRKHLNLQTGEVEEGTYMSAFRAMTETINRSLMKKDLKELKNFYKDADEAQKKSIKRLAIEVGFLSALYLVAMAVSGYADDDDSILAQTSAYFLDRMVNETSSSQFGVMGEFYNSFKEPLVGVNKLETLAKVGDLFDSSTVDRGRYAGLTHRDVYLIKNITGAKGAFDFSSTENLKSQRDSYQFFNKGSENFIPIAWLIPQGE